MKKIFTLAMLLLALSACGKSQPVTEDKPLVMGFVPHKDGDKLIEDIKPLEKMLSDKLGREVKGFTATNYVSVVEGFGAETVDFGIIPPFASVLATKEFKAYPILTVLNKKGKPGYQSQILVKQDSAIQNISDLKGKRMAFVEPGSTSGYLFPAAMLKEAGIDLSQDLETLFSGGHDKSLQLLLNGDVDVITTFVDVRERYIKEFPDAKEKTRVLALTKEIPGVSVTIAKHLGEEEVLAIKRALKEIAASEEGKQLLISLFNIHGFQDADIEEYDIVRQTAEIMELDLRSQE